MHDVLIVLAFYAVARISVGSTFIACMLTIVGYSINATIVIFDRVREELKEEKLRIESLGSRRKKKKAAEQAERKKKYSEKKAQSGEEKNDEAE